MLGLPEGVLGPVWPSLRQSFDQPVSSLAWIITSYTTGYLVSTVGSGALSERIGVDGASRLGVSATVLGLLIYLVTPWWVLLVFGAVILGVGAGTVDAAINADVALRYGQRVMHLLHAAFGVGATLGPLLVTAMLNQSVSWRVAYFVLVAFETALLVALMTSRNSAIAVDADEIDPAEALTTARRPGLVLAATLVYFALYVGSEVSVGQWSFSVLTEERGVGTTAAGIAVAAYWGGLTVGRLALGAIDERLHPLTLLRVSVVVGVAAAAWFFSNQAGAIWSLPILGLAFSGIFPSLVLLTPGWLGRDRVARSVGYQLSASSAGAIVAAGSLAFVARNWGLDGVPAGILVLVILLLIAHVATEAAAR